LSAAKYDHLDQRREPLTPGDIKILRRRAWYVASVFIFVAVITVISGGYIVPEAIRVDFSAGMIPFLVVWLLFLGIAVYTGYSARRAWLEIRFTHKIIYSGKITEKTSETSSGTNASSGPHGVGSVGGSGSSMTSYYAWLDGVKFTLEDSEWFEIEVGDYAEFHCARPGEAFRVSKVDAPKPGRRQRTNSAKRIAL